MKTIVHVNQHVIKSNRKHNQNDPVLTVKTYKDNRYAHEVEIDGPCKIIYRPEKPLSCGAHVWIETESTVTVKKENTDEKI
jgi:hypothetical protein